MHLGKGRSIGCNSEKRVKVSAEELCGMAGTGWPLPAQSAAQSRQESISCPMSLQRECAKFRPILKLILILIQLQRVALPTALVLLSCWQVDRMIPGLLSQMRSRMADTHLQSSELGAINLDCRAVGGFRARGLHVAALERDSVRCSLSRFLVIALDQSSSQVDNFAIICRWLCEVRGRFGLFIFHTCRVWLRFCFWSASWSTVCKEGSVIARGGWDKLVWIGSPQLPGAVRVTSDRMKFLIFAAFPKLALGH